MSSSAPMRDQNENCDDLGFGPYELVRPLRPSHVAARYLALHPENLSHHVAYRFHLGASRGERRRFLEAVETAAALSVPHILPVEQYSLASPHEAWVISPYLGDQDGLLMLSDLLSVKGGQMDTLEVGRVLDQLLTAIQSAHDLQVAHGPMAMDEILVDRSGAVHIELYGVRKAMLHDAIEEIDMQRDEIRSIVNIGYELITGIRPAEVWINPTRLVDKLDPAWDAFFAEGLDPAEGFTSANQALASIPGRREALTPPEVKTRSITAFGFARKRRTGSHQR